MSDVTENIERLMRDGGWPASKITVALKKIGDGNMQVGLRKLAEYYRNTEGAKRELRGIGKGVGATLIAVAGFAATWIAVKKYSDDKKRVKNEAEKILISLEDSLESDEHTMQAEDVNC